MRIGHRSNGGKNISRNVPKKRTRLSLEMVLEVERGRGVGIGDRGYWSPAVTEALAHGGIRLLAPYKNKTRDPQPERSRVLRGLHWLIETVNGQLAGRYQVKRTWAKDLWHLCHRLIRKVLSHTVAIVLTTRAGHQPLQFDAWAA